MIFTDEFVGNLKPRVEGVTIPSKAKVGQIAPVDVTIFKGPTGMDPQDIKTFHALNLSTKIQKGQISITADRHLLKAGDIVGPSEANFLEKLNIMPFAYGMKVSGVYYDGIMLD